MPDFSFGTVRTSLVNALSSYIMFKNIISIYFSLIKPFFSTVVVLNFQTSILFILIPHAWRITPFLYRNSYSHQQTNLTPPSLNFHLLINKYMNPHRPEELRNETLSYLQKVQNPSSDIRSWRPFQYKFRYHYCRQSKRQTFRLE